MQHFGQINIQRRAAIRQAREPEAVVEQPDDRGVPRGGAVHRGPVLGLHHARDQPQHQRQDDAGGEHRRQRRAQAGFQGMPGFIMVFAFLMESVAKN